MLTDEQQNQLKDILRLIPPDEQAAFLDMLAHDLRGRALTVASCAASQNTHGANSFSTANAQSRRCGLMEASWRWGVLLIVLTMAIHAAAVVTNGFRGIKPTIRMLHAMLG